MIGVLVPPHTGPIPPPEARPLGRAALRLLEEGVQIVFGSEVRGGCISGVMATADGWSPVSNVEVVAFYDRFPSQGRSEAFDRIRDNLAGRPLANPWSFTELCRDKVQCQRFLESRGIPMPALVVEPAAFHDHVQRWRGGFIKPRYGAFGRSVAFVRPGDPLPAETEGLVPGKREPTILQEPIPAPPGWAGISVRLLAQRQEDGTWIQLEPVVRRDRMDPVVNVARGAEAAPGRDVLTQATRAALEERTLAALRAFETLAHASDIVEAGLDFVVDPSGTPHLIEVNGRPQGRLEVLAALRPDVFGPDHRSAVERPLRFLATRR